jgi:hypothetical protein
MLLPDPYVSGRPVPTTADWLSAWSTAIVGLLALAAAAAAAVIAYRGLVHERRVRQEEIARIDAERRDADVDRARAMVAEVDRAALALMAQMKAYSGAWASPGAAATVAGFTVAGMFLVRTSAMDKLGEQAATSAGGAAALGLLWDWRLRRQQAGATALGALDPLYSACMRLALDGPAELHQDGTSLLDAAIALSQTYVATRWHWQFWARPAAVRAAEQKLNDAARTLTADVTRLGRGGAAEQDGHG